MPRSKTRQLPPNQDRFYRMPEVEAITGLRRSTIYLRISGHRFPAPTKLGDRISVWRKSTIDTWMNEAEQNDD